MAKLEQGKQNKPGFVALFIKSAVAAALILLGLSWPRLLAGKSALMEQYYSESIYQAIRRGISAISSLVPFSIAEFLLYFLVIGISVLLLTRLIQLILRKIKFRRLLGTIASILLAGGIVLNLFYATWGFNYFREPLATRMGLNITTRSVDELETYVKKTAQEAKTLRETLHEDSRGVFSPEESKGVLFSKLTNAYATLSEKHPVFQADPTRAKQIFWSTGLSWQGISGIYIGLTAEPNVNADQPPLLLYQAAAHEMAHQTGLASENEAELTGYLACANSDDPNIRYSGLAYALIVAGNALYDADSARYLAVTETYGDAIWRDFSAYNDYWDSFSGEVRQSADLRNDAYLKHNSQQSGIKSYGEAVDLLLAYNEKYGVA
ncbi:MAG: DUF3810 domain-containing protein [Clostridiaceae bacterium]